MIPQEFLSNKRELEDILRSAEQGDFLLPQRVTQGWRQLSCSARLLS